MYKGSYLRRILSPLLKRIKKKVYLFFTIPLPAVVLCVGCLTVVYFTLIVIFSYTRNIDMLI